MLKSIFVRNLNPETYEKAKLRAAQEGLSLSAWTARLIERELALPSIAEIAARMKRLPALKLDPSTAALIRQARNAR